MGRLRGPGPSPYPTDPADRRFDPDGIRRFVIANLNDRVLVSRFILQAAKARRLDAGGLGLCLALVFRNNDRLAFFSWLLAYQMLSGGRALPDSLVGGDPGIRSLYPLFTAWIARCLVGNTMQLPPVNETQGMAFVSIMLDMAEGHLRSLQAHREADKVEAMRGMVDAAFRSAGARWLLSSSFLSHVGHLVYAAALLELQRRGRLKAPPIGILPAASQNPFLRRTIEAHVLDREPEEVRYVEVISARRKYPTASGQWRTMSELVSEAAGIWSGDRPFAALDDETRRRGDAALAAAGIPPDAPVVTLHVREAGYNPVLSDMMSLRDARIGDYSEAIALLAARGVRVVRLGDRSMTPAEPQDGLFDYPFTDLKSDWMDVYLTARCRFHIGTSSGMSFVPLLFGRPVLFTNWITMAHAVCAPSVVILPKVLTDAQGAVVPLAEYCGTHRHILERSDADLHGLTLRDSAPDDIAEAVRLMDDGIDPESGRLCLPPDLFAEAQAVVAASPLGTRPQIAPVFWRRYGAGA